MVDDPVTSGVRGEVGRMMARRGIIASLIALATLLVSTQAVGATEDVEPPDTNVTDPSWDQSLPTGSTRLAGTATDNVGVIAVRVAIMDRDSGLWWHVDGTWGAYRWHQATIGQMGGQTTGWTFSWPASFEGDYGVRAQAVDAAGNSDPTPKWVRFSVAQTGSGTSARYLTIAFGRTQWVTTENCQRIPNTIALDQVAWEFAGRSLVGTGIVVVNRTLESAQFCKNGYTLHPSWSQLASLRDAYGWTFVSGGLRYGNMTLLTASEQRQESCGSLQAFQDRGHRRAWGLFGYPNNKWTVEIQREIVSTCFAYGRTYAGGRNRRSAMQPPWLQRTNSINGGRCNDSTLPCYGLTSTPYRYTSPATLASLFDVGVDEWVVVQLYRFVTGVYRGPFFSWDCTSSDWRDHWTSNTEMYCWGDFITALDQIPAGVTVTDPATVATAWGRIG